MVNSASQSLSNFFFSDLVTLLQYTFNQDLPCLKLGLRIYFSDNKHVISNVDFEFLPSNQLLTVTTFGTRTVSIISPENVCFVFSYTIPNFAAE